MSSSSSSSVAAASSSSPLSPRASSQQSVMASVWSVWRAVKRVVWQPARLPYPALWLLTRALFVPSVVYNMAFYMLMGRRRQWWNRITDDVLLGAMPWWFQFDALERLNVGGFVNLIEEFGGHVTQWGEIERRGLRECWIPTPDYVAPSLADIDRAIAFIEDMSRAGRVTYVHCKAGKGRAPTVVMCYLMKTMNIGPREAQDYIVARRPHISKDLYERPIVIQFHQRLQSEKRD
jgi:atypical dual specificity phosphatase